MAIPARVAWASTLVTAPWSPETTLRPPARITMLGSGLRDSALAEAAAGGFGSPFAGVADRAGAALLATLLVLGSARGVVLAPPAASQAALAPLSATSTHTRKELESMYDRTRISSA